MHVWDAWEYQAERWSPTRLMINSSGDSMCPRPLIIIIGIILVHLQQEQQQQQQRLWKKHQQQQSTRCYTCSSSVTGWSTMPKFKTRSLLVPQGASSYQLLHDFVIFRPIFPSSASTVASVLLRDTSSEPVDSPTGLSSWEASAAACVNGHYRNTNCIIVDKGYQLMPLLVGATLTGCRDPRRTHMRSRFCPPNLSPWLRRASETHPVGDATVETGSVMKLFGCVDGVRDQKLMINLRFNLSCGAFFYLHECPFLMNYGQQIYAQSRINEISAEERLQMSQRYADNDR